MKKINNLIHHNEGKGFPYATMPPLPFIYNDFKMVNNVAVLCTSAGCYLKAHV